MRVDPLAGLRLWAVTVEVGEMSFTIPAKPASEWVAAVLAPNEVFPLMTLLEPDDYEELKHRVLILGEATMEQVAEASQDALEVASGWPWWSAELLIRSAAAEWRIIYGEIIKRGLDPRHLPLGAWLNGLYAMATENLDETKRMAFDMRLDRPPTTAAVSPEEREAWAAQAFADAIAEAGGGLRLPPGTG